MMQDDLDFIRSDFYPFKVNYSDGIYFILDGKIIINQITENTWDNASEDTKKLIIRLTNEKTKNLCDR